MVRRSRKGESTIIASLILFVAVMGMAGATVFVFKSMADENTQAANAESDRTVNVMKTSFTVSSASYDNGVVYVYVKNTGKAQFDPDDLDIYIDGMRIPRTTANRTVGVSSDTDLINTGVWDETEELEFNVFRTYSVPETHTVYVYTPNGVKAERVFSS
jgi:archaellum component FlaG (FlaF/FlaG flagellin family)